MDTNELIELLIKQSSDIAKNGYAGWGNTMLIAADRLRELSDGLPHARGGVSKADLIAYLTTKKLDGKEPLMPYEY